MTITVSEHPCPMCGTEVRLHSGRVVCYECGYVVQEDEATCDGGELYGYE